MPHIFDDRYFQVTYRFTGTSAPLGAETTIGIFYEDEGGAEAVALAMRTIFEVSILTAMVTTITLSEVVARQGPDETGPTFIAPSGEDGGHIGSGAQPGTSYLIRKNTALGGRKNRGRMFVPGVDEDKVDASGGILPAWVTTLQGVAGDFFDAATAATMYPVVLHTLVPGPTQPAPTAITSLSVESLVATQRRRLRR